MTIAERSVPRPKRWDVPFGEHMTRQDVERLLRIEPFCYVDPKRFPQSQSLFEILLNDTRLVNYREGDIVVREGDYGGSAFLILRGSVHVVLQSLPRQLLGRRDKRTTGVLGSIAQALRGARYPEVRCYGSTEPDERVGQRGVGDQTRIFLQDVPGILNNYRSLTLSPGQIFGELAAMSRMPRSATVIAGPDASLLEIRWQGLRELMRRTPGAEARHGRPVPAKQSGDTPSRNSFVCQTVSRRIAASRRRHRVRIVWRF